MNQSGKALNALRSVARGVESVFSGLSLFVIIFKLTFFAGEVGAAVYVDGTAKVQLARENERFETIETWDLSILVDGSKYLISGKCLVGAVKIKEEVGSDGVDTFAVNDGRGSILTHGQPGVTGFAYAGRFPERCSLALQAVWLAYCSEDYFVTTNNTDLKLSEGLSWTPPERITNHVSYWPRTTLPKTVVGWSGNWVTLPGRPEPVELKHYPSGFRVWRYEGFDEQAGGGRLVYPKQFIWEGFVPNPPDGVKSGDDVTVTRRVVFLAQIIQETNDVVALPSVPILDLLIDDKRFAPETEARILIAHATPPNNWPVRASSEIAKLQKMVQLIKAENEIDKPKPQRKRNMLALIFAINMTLVAFVVLSRFRKNKQTYRTS